VSVGHTFVYPPEQARLRARGIRLAWLGCAGLLVASMGLALTVGQSEAMKTA
jgi:hypothetical protein